MDDPQVQGSFAGNGTRLALISVYDKTGVVEFARSLSEIGFEIVSSGKTARHLRDGGVKARDVSDLTGFPEILSGRVKTLHPKVHGGILGIRRDPRHRAEMMDHDIAPIDLVCVNLYPFRDVAGREDATLEEIVENIDIGGPAMIRAAAKNHRDVIVVVDPASYEPVIRALRWSGDIDPGMRFWLACKAFEYTAIYDAQVASFLSYMRERACIGTYIGMKERAHSGEGQNLLRDRLLIYLEKAGDLRYGENPHQHAAYYRYWPEPLSASPWPPAGVVPAKQVQGKELSFNNINDADAAVSLICEFREPAACVVKHTNPCGVACGKDLAEAFKKAYESDPVSIFGGIVAFNRSVTAEVAAMLSPIFLEVVLAPSFDKGALELLSKKKDLRLLTFDPDFGRATSGSLGGEKSARWTWEASGAPEEAGGGTGQEAGSVETSAAGGGVSAPRDFLVRYDVRGVTGGLLIQERDLPDEVSLERREDAVSAREGSGAGCEGRKEPRPGWRVVTTRSPRPEETADLEFAWLVCKHVKSNAIVIASSRRTCGIGGGQTSRIDAARIAVMRAGEKAKGAVMASDAFFPFPDVVEEAARAGITAIVQPGGSIRDAESIEACNARGIAMVFTGRRHFRH